MKYVELYVNEMDEVGVLYSPGFGAGWSTWNENCYAYYGGARDLRLTFVSKGTAFRINEYDGGESIELFDMSNYMCF